MPKPTVFVAMPFGEKTDLRTGDILDFDNVFDQIICPAIAEAGCEPSITNRDVFTGDIQERMISQIEASEVFLADISIRNANVFWELGVRHALRKNRYVIIAAQGEENPFNIATLKSLPYSLKSPEKVRQSVELISAHIRAAVAEPNETKTSPVYAVFPNLQVVRSPSRKFPTFRHRAFPIADTDGVCIEYALGDVTGIPDRLDPAHFDVIVVSENHRMQPPVIYERSFSARVHSHGAKTNKNKLTEKIRPALERVAGRDCEHAIGDAFITTSGEWRRRHGVQKIVHVAAVMADSAGFEGNAAHTFKATRGALNKIDEHNKQSYSPKLASAILPAFGAGQGDAPIETVMPEIVDQIVKHFQGPRHSALLKRVAISCLDDRALEAFDTAVRKQPSIAYTDEDIAETSGLIAENRRRPD